MEDTAKKVESIIITYSKKQIVNSKKYENHVDLVNALLDDDKKYSIAEVDKKINSFLKGAVK